ncbi:MAG: hypothetical protein ACAI43_04535, partial [Phycisphaerae bacterium]
MPWYGWAVVVVGAIVLAAVGLILSVPIRMYRGLISRHALARVRVAGGGSLVDVRFAGDVSSERVSALDPWLAARPRMLAGLRTSLGGGAAVPAVVVATDPLRIACYADEFDAVVLLRFDSPPPGRAHVALGDRLLCVATYFWARVRPAVRPVAPDIAEMKR